MKQKTLESYRQKLLDLGRQLRGETQQRREEGLQPTGGEASGGQSGTPLHLADLGTDQAERELTLGMLENEEAALSEVSEALRRIDEGRFGVCEECGRPISEGRLDALPYTRLCIDCARDSPETKRPIL